MGRKSFDAFKEKFRHAAKNKSIDLDFLAAKGFCHDAIAKITSANKRPLNEITFLAEDKLRNKSPDIPPMSTYAGKTFAVGIQYFVKKELGMEFENESDTKRNLSSPDRSVEEEERDHIDLSVWKKNMLGELIPRNPAEFTKQEVVQAVREAITEYGNDYAAKHSRLGQAQQEALSRRRSTDSALENIDKSSNTARSSVDSLSSITTLNSTQDEEDDTPSFTP